MAEEQGRLIADRYRLVTVLGQGGMGAVWRARDEMLGRDVAVKELRLPPEIGDEEARRWYDRTRREARSAAQLKHPGIITVYDVVDHDGRPWIVMELINGRTLADVVHQGGPLPFHQVAEIGGRVLGALRAAHAAGIVHRDVKPANVILEGHRVVLTDFGIAHIQGDAAITQAGAMLGTPAYMAPEQARRLPATPASDLWSLGATLYTAVEGHPPFDGSDLVAVLSALLTEPPRPPQRSGPLTPLLAGLLTKDPRGRIPAEHAAALLAQAADPTRPPGHVVGPTPWPGPQPGTTWPSSPARPAGRSPARWRVPLLIGAPVVVLALLLTVVLWPDGSPARSHTTASGSRTPTVRRLSYPSVVLAGHTGGVDSVAFSPDGKTLISGSTDDTVRLWDVATHKQTALLDADFGVNHVAVSPDGKTIAATTVAQSVVLWDTASHHKIDPHGRNVRADLYPLSGIAFPPKGKTVAVAGGASPGIVKLFGLSDHKKITTLVDHLDGSPSLAFSPDGKILATGGGIKVRLWDVAHHTQIAAMPGHTKRVWNMAFSPDGKLLATASQDGTARLWDVARHTLVATFKHPTKPVSSVAFSPDGEILATTGWDKTVRLWNVATHKPIGVLYGHRDSVVDAVFSPDGKLLATCGNDQTIRLWTLPHPAAPPPGD